MIAMGFVQGGASPCIYRHLEKVLRVWIHGDGFVLLCYVVNVRCFIVKLQEFWVVTNRGIPPVHQEQLVAEETTQNTTENPVPSSTSTSSDRLNELANMLDSCIERLTPLAAVGEKHRDGNCERVEMLTKRMMEPEQVPWKRR